MKVFNIVKVGYSAGMYGCTNEFYIVNIVSDTELITIGFKGMYGADNRIAEHLKSFDFKCTWNVSNTHYGKMTQKEGNAFLYENQAIELINNNFNLIKL